MPDNLSQDSVQNAVAAAAAPPPPPADGPANYSLEAMMLMVTKSRVKNHEDSIRKELKELKERQLEVKFLHNFMKALNLATGPDGTLDLSKIPDLDQMVGHLVNLGIEIDPSKMNYTKEERERLIENIRMTVDDLSTENDMQLQNISRLTNERYECFQLARAIMKPAHDDKINKARAISGR
jgi:hypothetical protein